ncbi:MAG: hypothetical protein Q7T01_02005 [bacterium]|nr:hypothetical protein [bacterium]
MLTIATFMPHASLPRSIRKYIRREKSRIRKTASTDMAARERIDTFLQQYRMVANHGILPGKAS